MRIRVPVLGWMLLVFSLASSGAAAGQRPVTYAGLVRRMTDMERLAELPAPGEKTAMFSSTDRRSRYDEKAGKYVDWHAGNDHGGVVRAEGKGVVLAEMAGPGVVWRIWSHFPARFSGRVKMFLDGQESPVLDMPFAYYFDPEKGPCRYPSLAYFVGWGNNLYFPIPYQKSCKIVAEGRWGRSYHVTYTSFPKGTKVPTYTGKLPARAKKELEKVDGFFRNRLGADPAGERKGQQTLARTVRAPAGKTVEVARLKGPRAITAFRVKMSFKDRAEEVAALQGMVLRITWDGQKTPAVWSPLGEFFGTGPGVNKYKSLAMGMTKEGFYSYWYMPFAKSAVVELVNEDRVGREVAFEIVHAPLGRPFEGLGHFHAKWHTDIFPPGKDRPLDWTVLKTQGRGRFCGMMLRVWSYSARGRWWGDGDEKFFIDGEKFPSLFGTGTQDYFGHGWICPQVDTYRAYHVHTLIKEKHQGDQSLARWHIADNIPFQKSFDGYLGKLLGNVPYAGVAYWYLSPGGIDPIGPASFEERAGNFSIRAAEYRILGVPAGRVSGQSMGQWGGGRAWNNGDQLWWTGAGPGKKLDIALPVVKTGTYELSATFTKANNYAIVQLYLDDKKLGASIDLYAPGVVHTGPLVLGKLALKKGDHKLTVEIVGANARAHKHYMFGLDQVFLKPR